MESRSTVLTCFDEISNAKEAKLIAPENLEIRFSKGANEESFLTRLTETVKKLKGEEPHLVGVSNRAISIQEPTRFGFPGAAIRYFDVGRTI